MLLTLNHPNLAIYMRNIDHVDYLMHFCLLYSSIIGIYCYKLIVKYDTGLHFIT